MESMPVHDPESRSKSAATGPQTKGARRKRKLYRLSKSGSKVAVAFVRRIIEEAAAFTANNPDVKVEEALRAALGEVKWSNGDCEASLKHLVEIIRSSVTVVDNAGDARAPAGVSTSREVMTTQEAAVFMGVSRQYVVELTNRGILSFRMVGRYRRLDRKEVEEFHTTGMRRSATAAAALARMGQEPPATATHPAPSPER